MADPHPPPNYRGTQHGHLDASGPRAVVFCHQCDNEWFNDDHGLRCPRCESEAIEIVTPENDPRRVTPDQDDSLVGLHNQLWPDNEAPDPDEGDLDEFVQHNQAPPPGRTMFFSQTFTTGPRTRSNAGRHADVNDPAHVIRDFHEMIGQFMGPSLRQGQAGRSGPEALFNRGIPNPSLFGQANPGPVYGGGLPGGDPNMPHVVGQTFTFTAGRPRAGQRGPPEAPNLAADDFATYAFPVSSRQPSPRGPAIVIISITASPDQLARLLGNLFGPVVPFGPPDGSGAQRGHGPPGLQGLLSSLFNPANAVVGDGVYTQEALDRIISTLMEQHPTSNAPGPASDDAIAKLQKKAIDEEMLGPERKAECSVCMDDVHLMEEVVVLPCKHWFHEICATSWLKEHNTCPICRKGIGAESQSSPGRGASSSPNGPVDANNNANPSSSPHANHPLPEHHSPQARRASFTRRMSRNEARLESIRDRSRLDANADSSGVNSPHRYQVIGDYSSNNNIRPNRTRSPSPPHAAGAHGTLASNNPFRRRDSQAEMSEPQRESRRAPATGGSDESRRSSNSGGSSGGGSGAMGWLRRLGGGGSGSGSGSGGGSSKQRGI